MGCIPSSPQHGGLYRSRHDDDYLTEPSFDFTERSSSDTCPYHPRGTASENFSHDGGLSRTECRQQGHAAQYAKRPSFLMQLFQTIVLFSALYVVCSCAYKFIDVTAVIKEIQHIAKELPVFLEKLWSSIIIALKETNFSWIFRKPALWWNTADVNWDQSLLMAFYLAMVTLALLTLDLLFSSEKQQGNPILLSPSLIYSVVYFFISVHAQASNLLIPADYLSFNTTLFGEKIFSQPEVVVMTFVHLFALDLALGYAMMKDFYTRVSSRRFGYRILMIPLVVGVPAQGIAMIPIYLLLRFTMFASPLICPPRALPANRNNHQRELDYLLDPVPRGRGAINGWVQSIPSPLNLPLVVFFVTLGVIRFFLMLLSYLFYVVFICFPISAFFFCLRRSWKLLLGKEIQGALYTPFETVDGKIFPPKAVLIVSAHIRLVCLTNRSNLLFNLFIGWWLRKFMEAYVIYEFVLPFKNDFSPYVSFLMEEFGPVFPMGAGLGFGAYKDVKTIVENPDQRKSGLSLAWSISHAQHEWSKNNLTVLPETEIEKSIVAEGRELVRCWLSEVSEDLKKPIVRKRLDTILPYANVDGSMVDKKLIEISFGSTLFHLLTGGELTEFERKRYYGLLTNAFPFMSDWINKVWFGGILEYNGIKDYDHMRHAFLRYLEAPALQRTLAIPEKNNWDAWSPQEVVRFLVYMYVIAGGAAPAFILGNIVQKLYENQTLASKYLEAKNDANKKRNIILEIARLERGVPLVNFMAHNFKLSNGDKCVTIFNRRIEVPDGTPLHCSIQNANRDVTVFGDDAAVINVDRDPKVIGRMLTFNGNLNDIRLGEHNHNYDYPARRCPGYVYALDIIQFLVDRYCPPSNSSVSAISEERLAEISRKETSFMKFVLKMGQVTYTENNKYFPQASEVKHPMDSNGRQLGRTKIKAAGERYIPIYDEDVPPIDMMKDKLTSTVLKMAPITDDEGEWESREEAIAWRMKWFNSNFPPVNTNYTSYKSVSKLVSHLAFSGMCSLHTEKLASLPESSLARQKCLNNKAVYVNDNTVLGSYRVRRGYQRYGAAAYFDRDFHLIGVYTCCDGQYYDRPSKLAYVAEEAGIDLNFEAEEFDEWRHALWAWRVSALAFVTVADHLVNVHMLAANAMVSSSRTYLPIDHPLRAFLKIFTYRTISINTKAFLTLTMPKGVINRNWAFEGDDLQKLLETTPCTFKKNFRDYIPASMRDVKDYPANHDLNDFCDAVTELVRDFLAIVYDSPGSGELERRQLMRNMNNDKDLQAFLEDLAGQLGLVKSTDLSSFSDIVNVLTSLICNVTGMHELVGQISDYFADPKIAGTTIRRGKEMDSIQIYQLNCTLVSSTGLRMPRLMGNWDHLLVRNRFADETTQVMQRFQKKLLDMSVKFDDQKAKDRKEKRRFYMDAFNPVNMECSVSV